MADALLELDFDFELEEIDLPVIDLSKIELGEFNLTLVSEKLDFDFLGGK